MSVSLGYILQRFSLPEALASESCAICLDPLAEAVDYQGHCVSSGRGSGQPHLFHGWCIERWTQDNYSCAVCKVPLFPQNLDILKLARQGLGEKIQELLALGAFVSDKQRQEGLEVAIENGDRQIVELLFPEGLYLEYTKDLIERAIREGQFEIMQTLLQKYQAYYQPSTEDVKEWIKKAAQEGHEQIFAALWVGVEDLGELRRDVALVAISHGHEHILDLLFPDLTEVDEGVLKYMFCAAGLQDDLDLIRRIGSYFVLDRETRDLAVLKAIAVNEIAALRYLLEDTGIEAEITDAMREKAIDLLRDGKDCVDVVSLILGDVTDLDLEDQKQYILKAAEYGHERVIALFFPDPQLCPMDLRKEVLEEACFCGQTHIIHFLFPDLSLLDLEDKKLAVRLACTNGQDGLISLFFPVLEGELIEELQVFFMQQLLEDGFEPQTAKLFSLLFPDVEKINPEQRTLAFIKASSFGNTDLMTYLFARRDLVEEKIRREVFFKAAYLGQKSVVFWLFPSLDLVKDQDRSSGFIEAARGGHSGMLELMLSEWGWINSQTIEAAFLLAIKNNDLALCEKFFEKHGLVDEKLKKKAVKTCINNRESQEVLQILLEQMDIEFLEECAALVSSSEGQVHFLADFFETKRRQAQEWTHEFLESVLRGDLEAFCLLRDQGLLPWISRTDQQKALCDLISEAPIDPALKMTMIHELLASQTKIDVHFLIKLVGIIIQKRSLALSEFIGVLLHSSLGFSEKNRIDAMWLAWQQRDESLVSKLASGSVRITTLEQAMEEAHSSGQEEVAAFLQAVIRTKEIEQEKLKRPRLENS